MIPPHKVLHLFNGDGACDAWKTVDGKLFCEDMVPEGSPSLFAVDWRELRRFSPDAIAMSSIDTGENLSSSIRGCGKDTMITLHPRGGEIRQKSGSDRCYGVAADGSRIAVYEYGCNGSDAELIMYVKR